MITKVKESWKIKLSEGKKQLFGSVTNIGFATGQRVWCYWKTVDGKEKCYFQGKFIEIWDDSCVKEIEADEHQMIPITNHDIEPFEENEENKKMMQLRLSRSISLNMIVHDAQKYSFNEE